MGNVSTHRCDICHLGGRVWNDTVQTPGSALDLRGGGPTSVVTFSAATRLTWSIIGCVAGCIISPYVGGEGSLQFISTYEPICQDVNGCVLLGLISGAPASQQQRQHASRPLRTLIQSTFKRCNCHGGD